MRGTILWFCIVFGVLILVFSLVLQTEFAQTRFINPHLAQVALISGKVMNLLGAGCTVSGTIIASPRFSVEIIQGCESIYPTTLLWAALLAYPAGWKARLIGIVGGAVILFILNIIRIMTMFAIGSFAPSLFDIVHLYAWQAMFIILTLAVWLYWAAKIAPLFGGRKENPATGR